MQVNKECGIMYTKRLTGVASMYLVTWIEGEEVNYRLVAQKELQPLLASIGQHVIIQELFR